MTAPPAKERPALAANETGPLHETVRTQDYPPQHQSAIPLSLLSSSPPAPSEDVLSQSIGVLIAPRNGAWPLGWDEATDEYCNDIAALLRVLARQVERQYGKRLARFGLDLPTLTMCDDSGGVDGAYTDPGLVAYKVLQLLLVARVRSESQRKADRRRRGIHAVASNDRKVN